MPTASQGSHCTRRDNFIISCASLSCAFDIHICAASQDDGLTCHVLGRRELKLKYWSVPVLLARQMMSTYSGVKQSKCKVGHLTLSLRKCGPVCCRLLPYDDIFLGVFLDYMNPSSCQSQDNCHGHFLPLNNETFWQSAVANIGSHQDEPNKVLQGKGGFKTKYYKAGRVLKQSITRQGGF